MRLGLGGGARAFIKALSEGSGVPAFVLYSVTQIGLAPEGAINAKTPGLGSRISFQAPTPHHRLAGVYSNSRSNLCKFVTAYGSAAGLGEVLVGAVELGLLRVCRTPTINKL